ncbi:hypothetical protein C8R44DRAFT_990889 [Mycena epipterygia]|nr:hypothetical protein C8R44DRAFT_990889 [Mycena epipterygia]
MSTCLYALNTDISGIGVRISYHLQTIFLGCLSARSGSLDEIAGALYTLMATKMAMAVTGMILGLKSYPEISFQDAIIIVYLLSMSWITVIFSLASCNRLSGDTKILQLSVLQSYVILGFPSSLWERPPALAQVPTATGTLLPSSSALSRRLNPGTSWGNGSARLTAPIKCR